MTGSLTEIKGSRLTYPRRAFGSLKEPPVDDWIDVDFNVEGRDSEVVRNCVIGTTVKFCPFIIFFCVLSWVLFNVFEYRIKWKRRDWPSTTAKTVQAFASTWKRKKAGALAPS